MYASINVCIHWCMHPLMYAYIKYAVYHIYCIWYRVHILYSTHTVHDNYVTSSYILCHIIIHTLFTTYSIRHTCPMKAKRFWRPAYVLYTVYLYRILYTLFTTYTVYYIQYKTYLSNESEAFLEAGILANEFFKVNYVTSSYILCHIIIPVQWKRSVFGGPNTREWVLQSPSALAVSFFFWWVSFFFASFSM